MNKKNKLLLVLLFLVVGFALVAFKMISNRKSATSVEFSESKASDKSKVSDSSYEYNQPKGKLSREILGWDASTGKWNVKIIYVVSNVTNGSLKMGNNVIVSGISASGSIIQPLNPRTRVTFTLYQNDTLDKMTIILPAGYGY